MVKYDEVKHQIAIILDGCLGARTGSGIKAKMQQPKQCSVGTNLPVFTGKNGTLAGMRTVCGVESNLPVSEKTPDTCGGSDMHSQC